MMKTESKRRTPNAEHPTPNGAAPKNRVAFEELLKGIVTTQLEKERIEGLRDSKILKINDEFGPDIIRLAEKLEAGVKLAEEYAIAHRAELLNGEAKSAETAVASFGFRMGKGALALLNEKWDWPKVIDAIKKKFRPLASVLIVVKEEPNKNAIKTHLGERDLAKIGTRIDQVDKFFIEPKRDPKDPRRLAAV